MNSLNKAVAKFNHHINDQAIKAYDITISSDAKTLGARCQTSAKAFSYGLAVSVERVGELLALAALSTVSLLTIPAAIILSPSLLFKSNGVQEFVNLVFHMIKVEAIIAKEIVLNLALPASHNPNIVQAFADQAKIYFEGIGVEVNDKKALPFAEFAAKNGNVEAQYILGMIYGTDNGPAEMPELARKYLELAATNNHPKANYVLYLLSDRQDEKFLQKAAEYNHPEAQFEYAERQLQNPLIAKEYFQKAADQGHPEAIFRLAIIKHEELTSNEGEDFNAVLELYSKAIAKTKEDDLVTLCRALFKKGQLLQKAGRLEEAVKCYEQADKLRLDSGPAFELAKIDLQNGNTQAAIAKLTKIGNNNLYAKILLATTQYKENNISAAVGIYKEVVEHFQKTPLAKEDKQAFVSILNLLYTTHYFGAKGFEPNLEEARKYALLLVDHDENKENLYNAGAMLMSGQGGPAELDQGCSYLYWAAEKGNANAANLIGESDIEYNTAPINGLIYLKVAEKLGHKEAGKTFTAKYESLYSKPKLQEKYLNKENSIRKKLAQPPLPSGKLIDIINSESDLVITKINLRSQEPEV